MKLEEYRGLVEALLPAVLAAGRIEMSHFKSGVEVETKADRTPVTVADQEAEKVLIEALRQVAPGIPVIAEEEVAAGRVPETGSTFFLVDPLDGTRAFISGSPEFTVNIGLVVDHRPVFGIIYAPASSELFATLTPHEAFEAHIKPDDSNATLASCSLTRLATREPDRAALVAFASRSHAAQNTDEFLQQLPITEKKRASSSLKFCLIARGEADLYARLGRTSEWDTAAGQAILNAAGGCVTTLDGEPLSYGKSAEGYANPHFIAWGREPLLSVPQ
ncbi:3'(2'),5'-bisphosphate nucleotidase CysQ [Hyphomicrobium sulfonivorans]|uniref:3'(2'),5'-bisphosphate nucleotidase CysQ n=1 Tax=Hyphomicrobium sulfonivorans TaxID=121290 RepID=UPI000838514D|nr:3'(2'),5'-bisphosphate nucleotidase CysQ [Hyphomicrobium sulfonivorans]MBI1649029.1 3'(2'),5'-bisphosphate nucleotidase CysQ [Hyphomicrobium sulfonivorans]NSL70437.1 3'(2'),5'-bisphosphate nucleotidase [Hyphomicrobium sulfonivorans]